MTHDDAADYIRDLPDAATVLRLIIRDAANPDVWAWNRWTLEKLATAALERIELERN